jgi:hypothetical protein
MFDKASLDNNPFVKELISNYFNIEHDEVVHRLHLHDKHMEAKRVNAYNYFLKSKTDPELKQRIDDNRRAWVQRNKEVVNQRQKEKLQDPEYRAKVYARKRELYKQRTADIPKNPRGRKPKQDINDSTLLSETESSSSNQ